MRSINRLGWGFSFFLPTGVWEDDKYQFTGQQIDTSAGRIDYDYVNIGISYAVNARYPDEPVVFPAQIPHAWKIGSTISPHIHWLQAQAAIPNFLMEYRIVGNGDPATGAFTPAASSGEVFAYSSGTILQITTFPDIGMSAVDSVSCFIDTKIYRDSANTSGLFAGADPVGAAVTVKEYDNHVLKNSVGSKMIYAK